MIVKMKKASMVVLESDRQSSLEKLRKIGVVHLEQKEVANEEMDLLKDWHTIMERSLFAIPSPGKKDEPNQIDKDADPLEKAIEILELTEQKKVEREEIERLKREAERLSRWGDFEPDDIVSLTEKGLDIKLYEITNEIYNKLEDTSNVFIINEGKVNLRIAVVNPDEAVKEMLPDSLPLPNRSLSKVEARIATRGYDIDKITEKLHKLEKFRETIQYGIEELNKSIKFAIAKDTMEVDEKIAHLTGFVPVNKIEKLEKTASKNGWVVLIQEPSDDDMVPTLIENPKWIRIIDPVFKLLGTVPGYKEYDISIFFLLFFSVFFAMIVGDGGYGLVFFLLTLFMRRKFKDAPSEPFTLLYVMSICTMVWGAITGTWFGSEALANSSILSNLVLPQIASYAVTDEFNTTAIIMHMTFIIGTVHITLAHLRVFLQKLPGLAALAELGWITIVWGIYLIVCALILDKPTDPNIIKIMLVGGFVALLAFGEQKGKFLQGLKEGFSVTNIIVKILNSIGSFSDVVSYVRLFAVGLATLEVAKSFNTMAEGIGFGITTGALAAFTLFFGHTLNIVLACMSLMVHGVRLNMLEFSGHLEMEWSGVKYEPFSEDEAE